jgi:AcrR family transcriptional regulator
MLEDKPLRRIPKQARGQRRVDQILDAAAALFAELGYESATTNAIAARADVPIGSLYQFFPNKAAVLEALVERYVTELRSIYDQTLSLEVADALPVETVVERLIVALADFQMSHVAFEAIFMNSDLPVAQEIHLEIVQRIDDLLAHRFPALNPVVRHVCATVGVGIFKGLLPLTAPPDNIPPQQVMIEINTAILAYLRAVLLRENLG